MSKTVVQIKFASEATNPKLVTFRITSVDEGGLAKLTAALRGLGFNAMHSGLPVSRVVDFVERVKVEDVSTEVFILEEDTDQTMSSTTHPIGVVVRTEAEAIRWRDERKNRIYSKAVIKDKFDE